MPHITLPFTSRNSSSPCLCATALCLHAAQPRYALCETSRHKTGLCRCATPRSLPCLCVTACLSALPSPNAAFPNFAIAATLRNCTLPLPDQTQPRFARTLQRLTSPIRDTTPPLSTLPLLYSTLLPPHLAETVRYSATTLHHLTLPERDSTLPTRCSHDLKLHRHHHTSPCRTGPCIAFTSNNSQLVVL